MSEILVPILSELPIFWFMVFLIPVTTELFLLSSIHYMVIRPFEVRFTDTKKKKTAFF